MMLIRTDQPNLQARVTHALQIFLLGFFTRYLGELTWSGLWTIFVVGLAAYHLKREPKLREARRVLETYAAYLIVYVYGVGGLWGFVGHFFLSDSVAASIGWDPGSPFQLELAFYHLAFGIMGALAIWLRGFYWVALAVGKATFLYGAAFIHIKDLLRGNTAPGNAGFTVLVWGDMLVPTAILIVTIAYARGLARTPP